MTQSESDAQAIQDAVKAIEEHWRRQEYDCIGEYLADDVVVARPGTDQRALGSTAYVQSYRDFDSAVKTLDYSAFDSKIDVIGDTAVAICPFKVLYETQETRHHEKGENTLVFSRIHGRWKIVWRTVRFEPVAEGSG